MRKAAQEEVKELDFALVCLMTHNWFNQCCNLVYIVVAWVHYISNHELFCNCFYCRENFYWVVEKSQQSADAICSMYFLHCFQ